MLTIAALLDRPERAVEAPAVRLIGAATLAALMAAAREQLERERELRSGADSTLEARR